MSVDLATAISLPPEEAVRWFQQKGYTVSWNWQETLQEANARAFTVAKVTSLELLKDTRSALDQALIEGKTERWFQSTLTPVLQKAGWWGEFMSDRADGGQQRVRLGSPARLRLIFRQNLQSAYMAGRWQEQLKLRRERPYLQYVAVMDSRTRPTHAALHGRVFAFDDPIWQTHYPPNGWGCRCRVRQLSEAALKRRGLKVESSDGRLRSRIADAGTDYETGEVTRIEVAGIEVIGRDGSKETFWTDPGFSYNAGSVTFQPNLDRFPEDIARKYVEGAVTGPEFERWFQIWERAVTAERAAKAGLSARAAARSLVRDGRGGMEYPVAVLKQADREALGTDSQTVLLSTPSLVEHLGAHPEISLADYQRVQAMVDDGEVYQQGDERIILLSQQGKLYRASIKVDQERRRLYLLSLFETKPQLADKQVRGALKRVR